MQKCAQDPLAEVESSQVTQAGQEDPVPVAESQGRTPELKADEVGETPEVHLAGGGTEGSPQVGRHPRST